MNQKNLEAFVFAFLACCLLTIYPVLALFLILALLVYFWYFRISFYFIFFILFVSIFFLLFTFFFWRNDNFFFFSKGINFFLQSNFKHQIFLFLKSIHSTKAFSLIKLLLLNIKDQANSIIIQNFTNLTIIHLVVVSGWHINFLAFIITKLFWKLKYLGFLFACFLCLFLVYLNDFSPPSFRAFLFFFFSFFKKTVKYRSPLTFLIIMFLAPYAFHRFGLLLSFFALKGINFLNNLQVKNYFFNLFFLPFFVSLFTFPILVLFLKDISLWSIFWSILWTPVMIVIYVFVFFMSWFNFLNVLFDWLFIFIVKSSYLFTLVNVKLPLFWVNNIWFSGILMFLNENINFYFQYKKNKVYALNKI